jgi:hypothetical protein
MSMRALWNSPAVREAGRPGLGLTGLMLVTYPAMLVAALVPSPAAFAAALAVSYATDIVLHSRFHDLIVRLRQLRFGISNRFLVRELLVILLVSRLAGSHGLSYRSVLLATLAFVALVAVQVLHGGLTAMLRKSRSLPFAARNIDMSTLDISDAPPTWLENRAGEKVLHTDLPLVIGLLVSSFTLTNTPGYIGAAVTFALAVGYLLVLGIWAGPHHQVPSPGKAMSWLNRWLREGYRPTVALSFSGTKDATYQVNMWLETLERMEGERPLVILREMHTMPGLARTTVPVLVVPSAVDLMNMDFSTVRVALYPAHVGKNLHLLRVPTMKHAFIGHGDSDKVASINPFGKAYDELWTAGKAGRDRWALADVGVRDEDVVEVGPSSTASRRPRPAAASPRSCTRRPGRTGPTSRARPRSPSRARSSSRPSWRPSRRSASSTSRTRSPAPARPRPKPRTSASGTSSRPRTRPPGPSPPQRWVPRRAMSTTTPRV